jgi:cystathionine gamma-synthase
MTNMEEKLTTLAVHAGYSIEDTYGAVSMPIILSTTFERGSDGEFIEGRDIYARSSNPNRRALEVKLAALEQGSDAYAFSSGQAATMSIMHSLKPGDHVIIPDDIYYGTKVMLQSLYHRWGLEFSSIDMTKIDLIGQSIKANTKLIWIETPSNPSLKITDIAAVVDLAKKQDIFVVCDNTWATPYYTLPFNFGVDAVMHSTTKYFGGHSDITGGCIMINENKLLGQKIKDFQTLGGAVPSAFDSWMLYRSIATFPMRMKTHGENAHILAEFLHHHPKIEKVNYPGLKSNLYHEVASRQMMNGYGGMMSILVKGGAPETLKLASSLHMITHATSLGGVESLVDHRQSAEGAASVSPPNLLRISVGIEDVHDLIQDFEQALAKI